MKSFFDRETSRSISRTVGAGCDPSREAGRDAQPPTVGEHAKVPFCISTDRTAEADRTVKAVPPTT